MTFWTKLQHELLCFVCAEDEIFDSAGDHKKRYLSASGALLVLGVMAAVLYFSNLQTNHRKSPSEATKIRWRYKHKLIHRRIFFCWGNEL